MDQGNDGTVETVVEGVFDQNDRLRSETEKVKGQAVKRTDYNYRQTEQIAKTVIDLINSRTESQTALEYNVQGRLAKITVDTYTNGQKTQSVSQEYSYNSKGVKVSQVEKVDANADGMVDSQSKTRYLTEALNHTGYEQVLEERRFENGQEVKTTTFTLGHDVLAQSDTVNGYLLILADGHGSTRGLANELGRIIQQFSYDAYGNAHGFDPAQALTSLLYSGEQYNPVSGLQYLRARWYNPTNGRFNRLDPYFGNTQSPLSFHKYAYAHMNPVMNADPSGLSPLTGMLMAMETYANMIGIAMRWFNIAFRAYQTASTVKEIIGYVNLAKELGNIVMTAMQMSAGSGDGAIVYLAREFAQRCGASPSDLLDGFRKAYDDLGNNFNDFLNRVAGATPGIASEVVTAIKGKIGGYLAAAKRGTLKYIYFTPTGPGSKSNDNYIDIGRKGFQLAVSATGGRFFGFGLRTSKAESGVTQLFRIDYSENYKYDPHYHILSVTPGTGI